MKIWVIELMGDKGMFIPTVGVARSKEMADLELRRWRARLPRDTLRVGIYKRAKE